MNYVDKFNVLGVEVRQRPCIKVTEKPTTATAEMVGELRLYENSEDLTSIVYVCAHEGGDYFWKQVEPRGELEALWEATMNKVERKDVVNSGDVIVDASTQIPTVNFMSNEISGSINFVFDSMLIYNLDHYNSNDTFPTSKAVFDFVNSRIRPQTLDEITDTLQVNTEYYLGRVNDIYLSFPTTANAGDVIYVNFETGIEAASLGVDLTNTTTEFDLIPDSDMGYEIFAKYNGRVWILSYSEYSLDGE